MIFRWLRGDTIDVNSEMDKLSIEQSDYDDDSAEPSTENKNPETK